MNVKLSVFTCLLAVIISIVIFVFLTTIDNQISKYIIDFLGSSLLGYILSFNFFIAFIVERRYNKVGKGGKNEKVC